MLAFFNNGGRGFKIRHARSAWKQFPVAAVRLCRKEGPVLAVLAGHGFLTGLAITLADKHRLVEYPPHLALRSTIILLLAITTIVSSRIKEPDSPFRKVHLALGITILQLYPILALLGLGTLF